MTIRIFLVICIVLVKTGISPAQSLMIGDTIPTSLIKDLDKQAKSLLTFENYPLTILDFWSHSCPSCIAAFNNLDQIQGQFEKSLNVVLINAEAADTTESLFVHRPWIYKPTLIGMITGDTILHKVFDPPSMPYMVWVDQKGRIQHITSGNSLSPGVVHDFITKGIVPSNGYKRMEYISSLFEDTHLPYIESFSYLAKSQYRLKIGVRRERSLSEREVTLSNLTGEQLFIYAFEEGGKYHFSNPWEVLMRIDNDSELFVNSNQLYDYDLRIPTSKKGQIFDCMKEDLERHFQIEARVEEIEMEVYALKLKDDVFRIKTAGGQPVNTFREEGGSIRSALLSETERKMVNRPYDHFVKVISALVETNMKVPFVDLIKYKGNIDVCFDALVFDFFTEEMFLNELERHGMVLETECLHVPVLILEPKAALN